MNFVYVCLRALQPGCNSSWFSRAGPADALSRLHGWMDGEREAKTAAATRPDGM